MRLRRLSKRNIILVSLVIIFFILLINWPFPIYDPCQCPPCYITNQTKDKILFDLHKALDYLQQAQELPSSEEKQQVSISLFRIIRLLDDNYSVPSYDNFFKVQNSNESEKIVDYVCPDVFTRAKFAEPYFLNGSWVRTDCKYRYRFVNVVTMVIVLSKNTSWGLWQLKNLLESFETTKLTIPIRIATVDDESDFSWINLTYKNIDLKVKKYQKSLSSGVIWNEMIKHVRTPFTLVARNLEEFNSFARLRRQVSIFDVDPRIKIVGGSLRNRSGHWQVGCFQTKLLAYTLEYKEGYKHSVNECMICDYIAGPFIAETKFLRRNKFQDLPEEILFDYFFLNVTLSSHLIFNCPDVMYMSTDINQEKRLRSRSVWLPLVEKWKLNRVLIPDYGVIHKFTCPESGISCKMLNVTTLYLMMPICCMDALLNGLKALHEMSKKEGFGYQLECGSVLGAVKLGNIIPWDFDGDGVYDALYKHLFNVPRNLTVGNDKVTIDHINRKADGFFKIFSENSYIEMFPADKFIADILVTETFRKTPTLIPIRGHWFHGPPSPGLYVRNLYGKEYLRHITSWMSLGKHWYSPYQVKDAFLPCKEANHHACLDQFEVDGSFQFNFN